MPQAPLPAPAARVGQVPVFQPINPGSYWHAPFNVLPYMQYPDMLSAAKKGLEMASMFAKLPREQHENAAQAAISSIAKTQADDTMARLKAIQADKTMGAEQKTAAMRAISLPYGMGPTGGTYDPLGTSVQLQNLEIARGRYGMELGAYPLEQAQRGQNLQSGAQGIAVQAGQNPGVVTQPGTTTTTQPNAATVHPSPPPPPAHPNATPSGTPTHDLTHDLTMVDYTQGGIMPAPLDQTQNQTAYV